MGRAGGALAQSERGRNTDAAIYPNAPGHRNVGTSIEAANDVAPKCGRLQRLALDAIASSGAVGLTADECAEVLGFDRYSIQPRTTELCRKGLIADSGLRRCNTTGKRATVWTLPQFVRGAAGEEEQ